MITKPNDCCCGFPSGNNVTNCERCRLVAEIAFLKQVLSRVTGFANKMSRSGAADRCRAGNDMLELLSQSFNPELRGSSTLQQSDQELLSAAKNEIIALRSELGNAYGTPVVCSAVAMMIEDRLKEVK